MSGIASPSPAPPLATLAGPSPSGDALVADPPPPKPTLAENPLAGHFLAFLPYEYQYAAGQMLERVHISKRTIFLAVLVAVGAGFYTGKLTIPESVKGMVSQCPQPQPTTPKVQQ